MSTASCFSLCIFETVSAFIARSPDTCSMMIVADRENCGEADNQRQFEFVGMRCAPHAQWIDDYPLVRQEFHKIQATKRRRILVLPSPGKFQIEALDLESETGNVIRAERQYGARCGRPRSAPRQAPRMRRAPSLPEHRSLWRRSAEYCSPPQ